MDVSRLTFTKETKEKMNKPLSHFEKGKLRWDKLSELENNGNLGKARNRRELSAMLGLGGGYGVGYNWVSNMINRGYVKETLLGFNKYNQPEYEYHIIRKPDYEPYGSARKVRNNNKKKNNKIETNKKSEELEKIIPIETGSQIYNYSGVKAVIRYNDLSIELDGIDGSIVENIISKLINR